MAFIKRPQSDTTQQKRAFARDLQGLCDMLLTGGDTARRWAARDLAAYPDAVGTLARALQSEKQAVVRDAIMTSLAAIGSADAVDVLASCLRDTSAHSRNDAIDLLKNMPEHVATLVGSLLHDADSDIRIFAVNILASLAHPDVEQWLVEAIETDENLNVCCSALDVLCEIGTEQSIVAIQALQLRFPQEPYIEFAATLALNRIRGQ